MDIEELTRERLIWHLETPVCRIMSGVRTHVLHLSLKELWALCYALKCDSAEQLTAVMWDMIQKRKRKDVKDGKNESRNKGLDCQII